MSIRVYDHTVADAFAGEDQVYCAHQTSTTQLDADAATSTASGSWTRLSGSGTIVDPTAHNTVVNDLALGDNWFVWTVDNGACGTTSDTVLVKLKDCLTLIIPDAFSPNDDGTNDVYTITNIENYPDNDFVVFNRWGNKVFEASPYTNTWDGSSQFGSMFGEKLPEGTYYYVLDPGTGDEAYTGFIYLRR
jgi:gliding motility-associated-like protein